MAHFQLVQPNGQTQPPSAKCLGPDTAKIQCSGRTFLSFVLGTQSYGGEFYILDHRADPVVILSYPFMAKFGIRIVPTQYVTNSLSSEPIRVNNVSAVLGQLPKRPTKFGYSPSLSIFCQS